jgi:ureidoglycolate hydrolase
MEDAMNEKIKVVELSKEAYLPIGQLVTFPTQTPTIQDEVVRYWAHLANFEINGTIDVGWVTMRRRPLLLAQLERHFKTVEAVIPVDDTMILPVAIGRDPGDYNACPKPEDVRGFYLRPGQMVTYKPGAWHFGGFPLNKPEASFIVFCRKGTADEDVAMQPIAGDVQVEFVL